MMKKMLSLVLIFAMVISCCSFSALAIERSSSETESSESIFVDLVEQYADAVNTCNVNRYIALFNEATQAEMNAFVDEYGEDAFFHGEEIAVRNIKTLSESVGARSSSVESEEVLQYDDSVVVYVEMVITSESGVTATDDILENGYAYRTFVLVEENGTWRILRISTPDLETIVNSDEGFGTVAEQAKVNDQTEQMSLIEMAEGELTQNGEASLLSIPYAPDPTSITVYFTKDANKQYYGTSYKELGFTEYIKNVIPLEWIVSYYGSYPAYLKAGAMASKMYAWWYLVHPKWNFAPYYSNVKDSTADQEFLYSAYSDLAFDFYREYVDETVSYLYHSALCRSDGEMFELHYHSGEGVQYSGSMGAAGALALAKSGYNTPFDILDYYYSYSTYTEGKRVLLFHFSS